MCAALSSYARACAAKGVMLWGWREHVCSESQAPAGLPVPAVPPWQSSGEGMGVTSQGPVANQPGPLLAWRSLESLSPKGGARGPCAAGMRPGRLLCSPLGRAGVPAGHGLGLAFGERELGLPRLTQAPPLCRQGPGVLPQVAGLPVQPDHLPADLPLAVRVQHPLPAGLRTRGWLRLP